MVECSSRMQVPGHRSKLRAGEGAAGRPTHERFPVTRWRLTCCHWRENRRPWERQVANGYVHDDDQKKRPTYDKVRWQTNLGVLLAVVT